MQLIAAIIVLVLALLIAAVLVAATGSSDGNSAEDRSGETTIAVQAHEIPPQPVDNLAALTESTTFTTVPAAPADIDRDRVPVGRVVHPRNLVPVYAQPGGPAIAALPPQQINSDTWLPVIAEEPGWVQVLLPSRPNGSTGWVSIQDSSVETAHTPYRLVVDRSAFRMQLFRDGQQLGNWTIGVGKPGAETPPGRTFIMASIQDSRQTFSPVILPLGTHSASHETYGGGPGTTGIHGWPTTTVFGRPSSDGCIRVPADALRVLSTWVPIGTPVLIT
ncbi:L,D-transpeptidase family protein [Amycolatopsis anabasis]|uniref:L,D-transpeptidase family protein n=1 Tax=Amycolatopsis anabasis TaxID=1840409 RepID=UPI00131D87E6|nr:L,D-transpeptidase family protein [Amycolatopsis anabasis]